MITGGLRLASHLWVMLASTIEKLSVWRSTAMWQNFETMLEKVGGNNVYLVPDTDCL